MKKTILYIAWAATALAGCGKEGAAPDGATAALQLQVGIGSMETRVAAVPGTTFARESKIKVVLTDYNGGSTHYNTSGTYIYKDQGSGGVWLPESAASQLQLNTNDARVLAHYPAALPVGGSYNVASNVFTPVVTPTLAFGNLAEGEYNSDNSFWFSFKSGDPKTEIFMAEGEIDYMYGQMTNANAVNSTSKLAQIKMHHGLTMVVFNLFKADQHTAPCIVKSITVKNTSGASALKKGTFTIPDGTFTAMESVEYVRTLNNFPDNSYFGMLMFPATIAEGEVVAEFRVDDQTYTLPIGPCTWQAGYVNLYRVRFTPLRAELVDVVKVVDWGTGKDTTFELN